MLLLGTRRGGRPCCLGTRRGGRRHNDDWPRRRRPTRGAAAAGCALQLPAASLRHLGLLLLLLLLILLLLLQGNLRTSFAAGLGGCFCGRRATRCGAPGGCGGMSILQRALWARRLRPHWKPLADGALSRKHAVWTAGLLVRWQRRAIGAAIGGGVRPWHRRRLAAKAAVAGAWRFKVSRRPVGMRQQGLCSDKLKQANKTLIFD